MKLGMPLEAALEAVGDEIEEEAPEDFEVWPENWQTVEVFRAMQTQWSVIGRMDAVLFQGLRYEALEPVFRLLDVPKKSRGDVFFELRSMEHAALKILNSRG